MKPFDYIITYLDPTDQYWIEQFKPYADEEFRKQPMRYDDEGINLLKYHIRGVSKYLPWINNLYLVVFSESQVPKWINRDTVKVVTDDMYIPKQFLPTFNTSTKQMHLQFIPGLQERFAFADDDFFPINPIHYNDFYDERDNPRVEGVYHLIAKQNEPDLWDSIVYNCIKFGYDVTHTPIPDLNQIKGISPDHIPHAMLKSDLIKYYNENKEIISKSITPCRCGKNILGYAWMIANWLKYKNKTGIKYKGIFGHNMNEEHIVSKYQEMGFHYLTINSNNKGVDYYKNQFEIIFPDKCKYEV